MSDAKHPSRSRCIIKHTPFEFTTQCNSTVHLPKPLCDRSSGALQLPNLLEKRIHSGTCNSRQKKNPSVALDSCLVHSFDPLSRFSITPPLRRIRCIFPRLYSIPIRGGLDFQAMTINRCAIDRSFATEMHQVSRRRAMLRIRVPGRHGRELDWA